MTKHQRGLYVYSVVILMVKFGKYDKDDVEYYKGIFVELKCPKDYAETLARGHLGLVSLTSFDRNIKNFMLHRFPFTTAKSMAEKELL